MVLLYAPSSMVAFIRKILRNPLHTFHDSLTGGSIVWYKDSYDRYIIGVGHTAARPKVAALHLEAIKKAIENPTNVTEDKDRPDRTVYYACFEGFKEFPMEPHMKVVVEETVLWGREIVTAFFTSYAGSREKQLPWKKP